MTTADIIKEQRLLNNLNQSELGKKLGVGKTTISNWETGYSHPDSDSIVKMSKIFGVTTDYLLCKTKEVSNINDISEYITVIQSAKHKKISPAKLQKLIEFLESD